MPIEPIALENNFLESVLIPRHLSSGETIDHVEIQQKDIALIRQMVSSQEYIEALEKSYT